MNLFQKYRSLRPFGRRLLLRVILLLPLIHLSVRLFGFGRVYDWMDRHGGSVSEPKGMRDEVYVRRVRHMVRYVRLHGPYRGNCLSRSMFIWWQLHRQDIVSDLRIGVRTEAGEEFKAHAWVEYQGEPVNAGPKVYHKYAPFETPILPSNVRFGS